MSKKFLQLGKLITRSLDRSMASTERFWTTIAECIVYYLENTYTYADSTTIDTTSENSYNVNADRDAIVIILSNGSGSLYDMQLPTFPYKGQFVTVKDGNGFAETDTLRVSSGAKSIDGASFLDLSENYQAVTLVYDGTEWRLL